MRAKRDIYNSELPKRSILVYFYLWDRANKSGQSFPSLNRIAQDVHSSVSTVRRALDDLEQAGFIQKDKRVRPNGGTSSNLYTIT